ncbi:hypothetical protein [Roseateles depolymerans]|uniref:Uncharacterized protein n=1 Tax=Roseateles depolymerans TaxID=76731 RepID=A0A0U3LP43_9BURK|nr:hypothetical protein [Roseateles depolymerans]ALV06695.1 hypothetical protein RD2015_2223 [Roseateles depolymerans]REG19672.1 hypothetical protein DES44_2172 [Roseateles depolymerans]
MLEAIERGLGQSAAAPAPAPGASPAPAGAQPRDELGRFTHKNAQGQAVDEQGNLAPDQAAALAAQEAAKQKPPGAEDLTQMPEGLGQKAQERFQKLANTNRDLTAKVEQYEQSVNAMREIWTENQVQPEQFQMAMGVIGAMNRGDYVGAMQALQEQLQQLSVLAGQAPGQIDPLAEFPDLRQKVNNFLIAEEDALQMARARRMEQMGQQRMQAQQQQQQRQHEQDQQAQRQQQELHTALKAVDDFTKEMARADLDYPHIEAQLEPVLKDMLQSVPPAQWLQVVKTQYQLIKRVATQSRGGGSAAPAAQPLRPTGTVAGAAKPGNMFDAMWANR